MTYESAKALYESARNKNKGKPIANNTRIVKTVLGYGVKLHNTIIVDFAQDGRVILATGGWQTVTTKARINQYTNARVFQRSFRWFLADGREFQEDMTL